LAALVVAAASCRHGAQPEAGNSGLQVPCPVGLSQDACDKTGANVGLKIGPTTVERQHNLEVCLDGSRAYSCLHELLTENEKHQAQAAERKYNLRCALTDPSRIAASMSH